MNQQQAEPATFMIDTIIPNYSHDSKAFPLKIETVFIGRMLPQEDSWSPLEPHCLNLNFEVERRNTEITNCTITENAIAYDFQNMIPSRRSRTDHFTPVNFLDLEETFSN